MATPSKRSRGGETAASLLRRSRVQPVLLAWGGGPPSGRSSDPTPQGSTASRSPPLLSLDDALHECSGVRGLPNRTVTTVCSHDADAATRFLFSVVAYHVARGGTASWIQASSPPLDAQGLLRTIAKMLPRAPSPIDPSVAVVASRCRVACLNGALGDLPIALRHAVTGEQGPIDHLVVIDGLGAGSTDHCVLRLEVRGKPADVMSSCATDRILQLAHESAAAPASRPCAVVALVTAAAHASDLARQRLLSTSLLGPRTAFSMDIARCGVDDAEDEASEHGAQLTLWCRSGRSPDAKCVGTYRVDV